MTVQDVAVNALMAGRLRGCAGLLARDFHHAHQVVACCRDPGPQAVACQADVAPLATAVHWHLPPIAARRLGIIRTDYYAAESIHLQRIHAYTSGGFVGSSHIPTWLKSPVKTF